MTDRNGLTPAQLRVLKRAARTQGGEITKLADVHGSAWENLLIALRRKGFAVVVYEHDYITTAGRKALQGRAPS